MTFDDMKKDGATQMAEAFDRAGLGPTDQGDFHFGFLAALMFYCFALGLSLWAGHNCYKERYVTGAALFGTAGLVFLAGIGIFL